MLRASGGTANQTDFKRLTEQTDFKRLNGTLQGLRIVLGRRVLRWIVEVFRADRRSRRKPPRLTQTGPRETSFEIDLPSGDFVTGALTCELEGCDRFCRDKRCPPAQRHAKRGWRRR